MENNQEQPISLFQLGQSFIIRGLECEIENQKQTLDIYRGFNWTIVKNQSSQQKINRELKQKADSLLEEIKTLKLKLNQGQAYVELAKAFLTGEEGAEKLYQALKSGEVLPQIKIPRKTEIPNLNNIKNGTNEKNLAY